MSTVLVGTVISGTMKAEDLLPAFLDELRRVDFEGWAEYECVGDAVENLLPVMDLLNEAAPEGYYFGTHWGDGADFGWWELEDE